MKVQVENMPQDHIEFLQTQEMVGYFNLILKCCTSKNDRHELERCLEEIFEMFSIDKYFDYGFASNHMWVTQLKLRGGIQVNTNQRLLIVTF